MSIPGLQTLMLPVLRIAAEGEVRISDVIERLAHEFALSAEERSQLLPSGSQTTFANRVHWAKSYLGKAGLVKLTKRAHFCITEHGREVLASPPERIDIKYLNRFPSFQQFREGEDERKGDDTASSPTANIVTTLTPDEIKKGLGKATGSTALEAKGLAQEAKGKVEIFRGHATLDGVRTTRHASGVEKAVSNHTIGIVTAILVLTVLIQVILVKSWTY